MHDSWWQIHDPLRAKPRPIAVSPRPKACKTQKQYSSRFIVLPSSLCHHVSFKLLPPCCHQKGLNWMGESGDLWEKGDINGWVRQRKEREREESEFFFLLNEELKNLLWNKKNIRVNYVFGSYPLHYNSI